MEIEGSVAVVTGASAGIGWATSVALAREGATLVVAARRGERLQDLAAAIRERGGEALTVECDVREWTQVSELARRVEEEFGRCEILINNAGIPGGGQFTELSLGQIESVVRTNYLGVLYATNAFLPMMLAAGKGHIVNLASLAGRFAVPGSSVYSSTKHAVVAFSEALYFELEPKGILVTSVNPGLVATEGFPHTDARERILGVMKPERVADLIVEVVRKGIAPERSIPRFLAAMQVFRVVTPRLYRFGLRRATRGSLRPTAAKGPLRSELDPVSTTQVAEEGVNGMIVYALIRQLSTAGTFSHWNQDQDNRIVYYARISGPYVALLKAQLSDLSTLPSLVDDLMGKGPWGIETLVPLAFGPAAPKVQKMQPSDHEAAVLINVQAGRARQVLDSIGTKPSVNGSAVVAGSYDLLVIVRGTDEQDIGRNVETDIQSVNGVLATTTCFILSEQYL